MSAIRPVIYIYLSTGILELSSTSIISASVVQEVNNLSSELPYSTLEFEVFSNDPAFPISEIASPSSERIEIKVWQDLGTEAFLDIGLFYLDEVETVRENQYLFRAIDLIGVMSKTTFDGLFIGPTPVSSTDLVALVLGPSGFAYSFSPSGLHDDTYTGWVPPGDYRAALQQVCIATGSQVTTVGADELVIVETKLPSVPLYGGPSVTVLDDDKGEGQIVKYLPLVTHIELVSHDYSAGTVREVAFQQVLPAGVHKIVFNRPYYSIEVVGPGYNLYTLNTENDDELVTENGDLLEAGGTYTIGPNVVYLNILVEGLVTITALPWVDNKKSYKFVEVGGDLAITKNMLKIEDAGLVTGEIAPRVLAQIRDFFRYRTVVIFRLFPTMKPGDLIPGTYFGTSGPQSSTIGAVVRKMTIDLSAGYLAMVEGIGTRSA